MEMENKTIRNEDIANTVSLYSSGKSLIKEHLTLMKTTVWFAASTAINENINLPRKSIKWIVLLFTKENRSDSEEFIYPNIDSIKITIEGTPNMVYSQRILKIDFAMKPKGSSKT